MSSIRTSDERPRALTEHVVEVCASERERPFLAGARWDGARDLVDERLTPPAELLLGEREHEQAHAAVDVVADAAGGDDAVRRLHRRDAADREAVALVDVRHGERGPNDPWERGDVLELLERLVALDGREQLLVREDTRGHAHVRTGARWDFPERLV